MALDKITPMSAPPGHSLTGPPGKWPWERPPQFANPDDAIDFIINKIDNEKTKDKFSKLMLAGITVEELVSQISFKGFTNGFFNPDVAELIKPALAVYMLGVADENGLEPKIFVNDEEEEEVDDRTFFKILGERNTELFAAMNEIINEKQRFNVELALKSVKPTQAVEKSNSFLDVEEKSE